MKQLLLFSLFILFSVSIYSQVQGPPPPCGITTVYICDKNNDGFEQVNLREAFPFSTFCRIDKGEPEDYFPIAYYLTQDDMNNQVNEIINPELYTNISSPQNIYYRANKIIPDDIEFLSSADNFIQLISYQKGNLPTPLVLCDLNNDGTNTFELEKKDNEILAGLDPIKYRVKYYASFVDAENATNELPKDSYSNVSNPQTVYARMEHVSSLGGCGDIVELSLIVQDACQDIAVYLMSYGAPRPGFDYNNRLIIKNEGPETVVSGSVEFVHDASITFNSVTNVDSGNTTTNTATGFILNFVDLEPNEQEVVRINMNVPVSTSLGTLLTNTATYSVTDLFEENNSSILSETVIGSYDPNDITEFHGPDIFYDDFDTDDYLFYTIRCQNVGTANAINVRIENTLDVGLDPSTIVMLDSSHGNVFARVNNQLTWQFDDIHLPSEDMDEPNSHGYVYYKIKPTAGYKVGDIIPNTAKIYFDFNPAVITNTFQTEFVATLSSKGFTDNNFFMSPNPTKDYVEIRFNKNISHSINIVVYNVEGKELINSVKKLKDNRITFNASQFSKGMYFVKLNDGTSEVIKKLIVN